MNVTTLVFLGLAVVWAIVLLPEVVRKVAGSRHSDTIRSFNQQLSVLDRSGDRSTSNGSNVIDLRSRDHAAGRPAAAPQVPASVRKRRQEVLTVLGSAAVLTLVCTVAFGGAFLIGGDVGKEARHTLAIGVIRFAERGREELFLAQNDEMKGDGAKREKRYHRGDAADLRADAGRRDGRT